LTSREGIHREREEGREGKNARKVSWFSSSRMHAFLKQENSDENPACDSN